MEFNLCVVMGAADGCLYIERECKTEDYYSILGSQTPVVCLCTSVCVRIRTIDRACVPTLPLMPASIPSPRHVLYASVLPMLW